MRCTYSGRNTTKRRTGDLSSLMRATRSMRRTGQPCYGHISGGLEAGIEGTIHAMRILWEEHNQEEDWRFILINARNAFNEENQTAMLWSVQNEWPSGTQFTFNCYRHWAVLVIQNTGDESGQFLHSKEGVTQGDPLTMIAYGIGVLPLVRELRGDHPGVTHPW